MASITINNLNITGFELFADEESFLSEVSNEEMLLQGGMMSDIWTFLTGISVDFYYWTL